MTVPAAIYTNLSSLIAQVAAANPISSASQATQTAIVLNAQSLVTQIAAAQAAAAGALDSWKPPVDPGAIASGILGVTQNATDQWALSDMLALVGRADLNIQNEVA
jgi:hypothetical protein